jgi:hypothetical protein
MKPAPNNRQLAILQKLVAGLPMAQIRDETGVSVSSIKRTRLKFASLLAERDDEVASRLAEAKSLSSDLLIDALDQLRAMMNSSDSVDERLAIISQVLRAFSILNPPIATPAIAPKAEERSPQVVIHLPDNGRGDLSRN